MSEQNHLSVSGNIIDVVNKRIYPGTIYIENGIISNIVEGPVSSDIYIAPGLIDSHIHIESSMLTPAAFARLAVTHGTVATVSDPHEIANVLGVEGVKYMIESGNSVPFKFYFGAPSCVPATDLETAGAVLGVNETKELLANPQIKYLAEMMNFPGVISEFPDVINKLKIAKDLGKPIDGHAPGLSGEGLKKYVGAGISTDHECMTAEEGREKIALGMKVLIREGSAAKNFAALMPLITELPEHVMFCSDDKHVDDLIVGHIDRLVKKALSLQIDPVTVFRITCYNPVKHYDLAVGLLQKGDAADFITFNNLSDLKIQATYINGYKVAENGECYFHIGETKIINNFASRTISADELKIPVQVGKVQAMEVIDGELFTKCNLIEPTVKDGYAVSDTNKDLLKLVIVNRYQNQAPAKGFVYNFGLKRGAIAQSVAHDSHNIIAVGANDEDLLLAINKIMEQKGGLVAVENGKITSLSLPIAGLMTSEDGYMVAAKYQELNTIARDLGSHLTAPWMTLSFLALLVIPELKLGDRGLFDGKTFSFTPLFT
ncbi:MAG: adenine deaminase [Deltaproteobacteria bacterium]|nr:adenine deaminase [Deltaproteobacteria bacterium]